MTLRSNAPLKKQRWFALGLAVGAMVLLVLSAALSASDVTSIPVRFFTVEDQQGANDVPGQVDLTQMGRDDTDATTYSVFWSWDSIDQWTGTGQTGDACALFDTNGDTFINFVACVRVENPNADPTVVKIRPSDSGQPVYLFACSDKKNDRCTNPSPVAYTGDQASAGKIVSDLSTNLDPTANLITDTDPFDSSALNGPGTSWPQDSTVELRIAKDKIPENEVLVNVCSYPSAGNGGNNNPFDCIVSPGGGFLIIEKDADPDDSTVFTFDVHRGATKVASTSITGDGEANEIPLIVGTNIKVTETSIPSPWDLKTASCKLSNGTGSTTGTYSAADDWVSGITIESGGITRCVFQDRLLTGTLEVKKIVINDNGGTKKATDFSFSVNGATAVGFTQDGADELKGKNTFTLTAGTSVTVTEPSVTGYSTSYNNCSSLTITAGQTTTCTITNDDNAPALHLRKTVTNDNGGTALNTAWTLKATGTLASPTNLSGSTPVDSGSSFKADTYTLSEENGPSGYTAGAWSCVVTGTATPVTVTSSQVTIALGDDVTCTINNDDTKASPAGTTVQSWVLHDSITITGIRSGSPAPAASVTFRLYDSASCTTPIYSETDTTIVAGVASTTTGYSTSATGFYYWTAQYSGDQYNEGFTTACGDEVTQIQAKDAYGGGRNNLIETP